MKLAAITCAAWGFLFGADPAALVRSVGTYEFGGDPRAVRELEALAYGAAGSEAQSLEKLLLAGLDSARTLAAKDALCRDLGIVGGDAAVDRLSRMLLDGQTAEMARQALERIPGARSAAALRDAAAKTSPPVQTGLVVSLGRRRDAASVPALQSLLSAKDTRLAQAAAAALAKIATREARQALQSAAPAQNEPIRAAGLDELSRLDAGKAAPALLSALHSDSARVQAIAIRALARSNGAALAMELPGLPDRARVRAIYALAESAVPGVLPLMLQSVSSDSEPVRVAALNALGKLGTAAEVPMLAGRAASAGGTEQAAARAALVSIRGEGVEAAILQAVEGAEPKIKVELIRAAGERGIAGAAAVLLAAASDTNRTVRVESIRALRETAGPGEIPALLAQLQRAGEGDRREWERATGAAIRRAPASAVQDVLAAYGSAADIAVRVSLLRILSAVGNAAALPVIRETLRQSNAELQRAALDALASWPTPEPMDDLLGLARTAAEPARRILALRGYLQLAQLPSSRTPAETARLLAIAMGLAARPEEKRTILAAAQRWTCPESLALARAAEQDPAVAAEARLAVTTLERGLAFLGIPRAEPGTVSMPRTEPRP